MVVRLAPSEYSIERCDTSTFYQLGTNCISSHEDKFIYGWHSAFVAVLGLLNQRSTPILKCLLESIARDVKISVQYIQVEEYRPLTGPFRCCSTNTLHKPRN